MARKLRREGKHIAASFKVVVLVAVVGIAASVFVAFRTPALILAPDEPVTMIATVVLRTDEPRMSAVTEQVPTEAAARMDQPASAIAST